MDSYFASLNYQHLRKVLTKIQDEATSLAELLKLNPAQIEMASFTAPMAYAFAIDSGVSPLQSYNIALQTPNLIPVASQIGQQVATDLANHNGSHHEQVVLAVDNAARVIGEGVENIAKHEGASDAAQQYIAEKLEDLTKRKTFGFFRNINDISGSGVPGITQIDAQWIYGGGIGEWFDWGKEKISNAASSVWSGIKSAASATWSAAKAVTSAGYQYGIPALSVGVGAGLGWGPAAIAAIGLTGLKLGYDGLNWAIKRHRESNEKAEKEKKAKLEKELYNASNQASQAVQELNEKIRRSQYSSGDSSGGINQMLLAQMSQLQQQPPPPPLPESPLESEEVQEEGVYKKKRKQRKKKSKKKRAKE